MECYPKQWSLASLNGLRERVDTNPDWQRPAVWAKSQKQLLIDTILRSYDVPKLYCRKVSPAPVERFEVIDGQQRIRAIWEFMKGDYALPKDADPVGEFKIANCTYDDLPLDLRLNFDQYELTVTVVANAEDDEVREMFLRLQNGTTLKAQEKRNAMPGTMRNFVRELTSHPFFGSLEVKNKRYAHDLHAAQFVRLELAEEVVSVRDADLSKMYEEYQDFDKSGKDAKSVKKVLSFLGDVFPERIGALHSYMLLPLYLVASNLVENYVIKGREAELREWLLDFYQTYLSKKNLSRDDPGFDEDFAEFQRYSSHSTDQKSNITWRYEFMMRQFLASVPDLELIDKQRDFTHEQRMAIYRLHDGHCQIKQKCAGEKCRWDDWAADHIKPHSKGGQTTVENGQVACPACNAWKKDKLQQAQA